MKQREKTELARNEIRKAAKDLFSQKGYELTSIQDIAEASGYSVGSVYRQWAGKQELFLEIWDDYVSDYICADIEEAPENPSVEEMIDYLLERSRLFANAETTCHLRPTGTIAPANSEGRMSDWAGKYQEMICTFLKSIYPDTPNQRLQTVAGVLHSVLNADAMRKSEDNVPHYEFAEESLRDCLLAIIRTCEV